MIGEAVFHFPRKPTFWKMVIGFQECIDSCRAGLRWGSFGGRMKTRHSTFSIASSDSCACLGFAFVYRIETVVSFLRSFWTLVFAFQRHAIVVS